MENEEIAAKYGVDLKKLEKEQAELAKSLQLKDACDFSLAERIGAVENIVVKDKIISAMIVCDRNYEIIEQEYFLDKLRFPYIHGFRAYRELPSVTAVFNKIKEKPEVVLVDGEGINHSRLGIASHFSLASGVPCIGVSDHDFEGNEVSGENVLMKRKKVGKVLISKIGSRQLYICPGDKISIASAFELVKSMIVAPHKMPEPLHLAHKYAKSVQKELKLS